MKCTLFACICLFPILLSAQKNDSTGLLQHSPAVSALYDPIWQFENTNTKIAATFYGDVYSGSNSITTDFLTNLYLSGFINTQMKDIVSDNLVELNRVGILAFTGIGLTIKSSKILKGRGAITTGIEYNNQISADFTDDLFHLIFYGNFDLQDETAIFDQTSVNQIEYIKYRIGSVMPFDFGESKLTLGFHANILQGMQSTFINVKQGSLYTAPDGLFLDATYNFTIQNTQPDTGYQWQGIGAGADFYAQFQLKEPQVTFAIMANDLGFINWATDTKTITGDTSIVFQGFEIGDLLDATSNALFEQDTLLQQLNVKSTPESYVNSLPFKINATVTKIVGETFFTSIGLQHIFNSTYKPIIYARSTKIFPSLKFAVDATLEYGGYSGFNFGIGASKQWHQFGLQLHANNLLGIVNPKQLSGAAAYLKVHYAF